MLHICDVCTKLKRKRRSIARYRVQFGTYAGAWFVCQAHYQPLLTEQIPKCVIQGGMECSIDELIPSENDPLYAEYRPIATISKRAAA